MSLPTSKVGRVPHVRDAPQSAGPKPSGRQKTARPTNAIVTARGRPRPQKYAAVNATISKLSQHRYCCTPKKTSNKFCLPAGTAAKMAARRSGPARARPGRRRAAARMAARQTTKKLGVMTAMTRQHFQPKGANARLSKVSWLILHREGAETPGKVGRVPHMRDAPQSAGPKPSGGQRTARPT